MEVEERAISTDLFEGGLAWAAFAVCKLFVIVVL